MARVGFALRSCRGHYFCDYGLCPCVASGLGRRYGRLSSDHVSLFGDSAPDPRASHGGRGDQALSRRPGFAASLCALHLADLRQPGPEYGHAYWLWGGDFMADGLDASTGLAARKKRRVGLTQRFLVEGYNVF